MMLFWFRELKTDMFGIRFMSSIRSLDGGAALALETYPLLELIFPFLLRSFSVEAY